MSIKIIKKSEKERNSNIELLRVVAMFMIVIYHIIGHCVTVQLITPESLGRTVNGAFNHPVFYKRLLVLDSLLTFGNIGNAIFILISGYFCVAFSVHGGGTERIKSISEKLIMQLGFSCIVLICVPTLFHFLFPKIYLRLQTINLFNDWSWFVGYYFVVILCGYLFLNNILNRFSPVQYTTFVLIVFCLISFNWSGTLLDSMGISLRLALTGVFYYSLGGLIKKYNPFGKVKTHTFFLTFLLTYIIIWISKYNFIETSIENYNKNGQQGSFTQDVLSFGNHSIVIIISAVCIFEIFTRIRIKQNRVINFLGKSTFMVYLIHDNDLFYFLWNTQDWIELLHKGIFEFLTVLMKCSIGTFFIGVAVYILYLFCIHFINKIKYIFIGNA